MAYTTINKSTDYFNTKLYTGNAQANHSITGVGFQPDFTWIKCRHQAYNSLLWDAVRTNKASLTSNNNEAELTTTARTLTSFDSDGFTLPNATGDIFNDSGQGFVSWNWKANGSGSANTDGSITSTVSANTTSGFSIVKYTGTASNATVGHGLGAVPKMIIVKNLISSGGSGEHWYVYHASLGNNKDLLLNLTNDASNTVTTWNTTTPTSSVFSIGSGDGVNKSSEANIAYCFAEKTGYSKFASYVGNGSNSNFIYTGFKPAFVMVKKYSSTSGWYMNDTARDFNGANGNDASLFANTNGAEFTSASLNVDMLSNGFKLTSNNSEVNGNTYTYIYMCFAAAPLVGTNNVPCTAR